MDAIVDAVREYLREVESLVCEWEEKGEGMQVIGAVPGRSEEEDVEITLDEACDNLFSRILRRHKLRVHVRSEHGPGHTRGVQYRCAIDPFDGSGLYRRGLRKEWYSVLSFFDLGGMPIVGGAIDIRGREMYLAAEGRVTRTSTLGDVAGVPVAPATKTEVDDETVIATYSMSRNYRLSWREKARSLDETFTGLLWGNGGSCIYPLIAAGEVHAYIMFDEPITEIDPGLAFATVGGFHVFSVQGLKLEPYRFNHRRQFRTTVPFFIAACTAQLAEDIVQKIGSTQR